MTEDFKTLTVGRYMLHRKIARGGMATIHIARLVGDVGFSRIVAAKRMHPELADDDEFVAMFLDEARIASKVHHRNVVNVLDVVTLGDEVMLVQEYVHGAPLSVLLRAAHEANAPIPVPVAAAIACHILAGLHAAHETHDELGEPLHIVHRDVSPQNIMVGADGTARLLDFGVAKAAMGAHVSRKGTFKGKLGYSSPEQIRGEATRQSDIYSLGVVLWELLVGHRLHNRAQGEAELIAEIIAGKLPTLTDELAPDRNFIGPYRWREIETIEPIVRRALDVKAKRRWETAADMEEAIAAAVPVASATDVAAWLRAVGRKFLDEREQLIAEEEASWRRQNGGHSTVSALPKRIGAGSASNPIPPRITANGSASHPSIPLDGGAEDSATPRTSLFLLRSWLRRAPTAIIATVAGLFIVAFVAVVTFLLRDLNGTVAYSPDAGTADEGFGTRQHPRAARAAPPESMARPAGSNHSTEQEDAPPAPESGEPDVRPTSTSSTSSSSQRTTASSTSSSEQPASVSTTSSNTSPNEQSASTLSTPPNLRPAASPTTTRPTKSRSRVVRPSASPRPGLFPPAATPAPAAASPPPPAPPKQAPAALDCSTPFYFEGRKKIFKTGCL